VSKTLALSNIILKPFHTSILRSLEWALSSLPNEISNTKTARLHLFKKTGPFSRLVIYEGSKLAAPPPGGTAYPGPHVGPNYDERPLTNRSEKARAGDVRERAELPTWMTHR